MAAKTGGLEYYDERPTTALETVRGRPSLNSDTREQRGQREQRQKQERERQQEQQREQQLE